MPRKGTARRVDMTCARCGRTFPVIPARTAGRWMARFCSNACKFRTPLTDVRFSADGVTAEIPLYARGGSIRAYSLVDAADIPWIVQNRWSMNDAGYAVRSHLRLHREILGLTRNDGLEGDHINRTILDNRRGNLRIVTHGAQMQNRTNHRGSRSKFRGVTWHGSSGLWVARVRIDGKTVFRRYFKSEEAAGEAAKAARLALMPGAVD